MDDRARPRRSLVSVARLAALPALIGCGVVVARFTLAQTPPRFAVDLAQPLPVVTWWGATGAAQCAILFVTLAFAFLPYLAAVRRPPSLRATLSTVGAALAIGLAWVPLFSSDTYAYTAYGEMSRIGLDPYVHQSSAYGDPLIANAFWQWQDSLPLCVYGPLFVALAKLIVTGSASLGSAAPLLAFRVLACTALLACGALIARCANDTLGGRRAAWLLAANPIALWSAIEGHNDALMLALALAAVAIARRSGTLAIAVASVSALVKIPAVALAGVLAVTARRRGPLLPPLAVAAVCAAVVSIAYEPLLHGIATNLAPRGHYQPLASVQAISPVLAALLAVAVLFRIRRAPHAIDRWSTVALAAWLAIPNPYAWYGLWLLPLAALATDPRVTRTILAVTACALLRYLPDAVAVPSGVASVALGIPTLVGYTPLFLRAIISGL